MAVRRGFFSLSLQNYTYIILASSYPVACFLLLRSLCSHLFPLHSCRGGGWLRNFVWRDESPGLSTGLAPRCRRVALVVARWAPYIGILRSPLITFNDKTVELALADDPAANHPTFRLHDRPQNRDFLSITPSLYLNIRLNPVFSVLRFSFLFLGQAPRLRAVNTARFGSRKPRPFWCSLIARRSALVWPSC